MKILKMVLSAAGTLFFAGCMFFSFVAGAPGPDGNLSGYVFWAGGFSILFSVFACICINYILHLQHRIEDLEEDLENVTVHSQA